MPRKKISDGAVNEIGTVYSPLSPELAALPGVSLSIAPPIFSEHLPEHSPLGASSAERWMNCSGSVALTHAVKTGEAPEEDDPDYRRDGVQAHALAAWCLENNTDAWEGMGQIKGNVLTEDMMSAVQVYLDFAHKLPGTRRLIEVKMHVPEFHPLAFGTGDLVSIRDPLDIADFGELNFVDYKHGEGIVVEVVNNKQLMYYVYLFIGDNIAGYPDDMVVHLHICQPRAPHRDGPIRSWSTTARSIRKWAAEELRPAMERTIKDRYLSVGEWCRFCPAKLICPAMTSLGDELTYHRTVPLKAMPAEQIGDFYQKAQWLKMFIKDLEAEASRRVLGGDKVPGIKAVQKRANRAWKEGAEEAALRDWPEDEIYTTPVFLGPPAIEKLPDGKLFVAEWAYTPDNGLTIALESDSKPAVSVSPEAKYGDPTKLINRDPFPAKKNDAKIYS